MRKITCIFMALLLMFTLSAPVYAADTPSQKEEDVYGILNVDGSVDSIYVVNTFGSGDITDYGNYTKIQNLTTSEKLKQSGDEITVHTTADKLYYQGTLESKQLPWSIAINYNLDGKQISGTELAGKSGALRINLIVIQNPNINDTFFKNYALQIGFKLDTRLCDSIETTDATVAQAGSAKQLNYTVLPGKKVDITVTADIHDFEMEAVTINGIKLSMDFDIDTDSFKDQISQLISAIEQLDDGAGELGDGAQQLSSGMDQYIAGLKVYTDGMSQLGSGVGSINTGAASLRDGLSKLSKQNNTLVGGALEIQNSTFDTINQQLSQMGLGLPVLTPENYSSVLKNIPNLASVMAQLDGIVQFTQGIKSYTDGVTQLRSGASGLADGTYKLKNSVSVISSSANELYNAGAEINSSLKKLRDGLVSYKEGTGELRSETLDMDTEINKQINEIMKGISGNSDGVTSFVSEKNTNISAVQFVLKTASIEKAELESQVEQGPVRLNFWQKLLALFGINV